MSTRTSKTRSAALELVLRIGTLIDAGARGESARRRRLWALVALAVVIAPLAFTLARDTDYKASVAIYPRAVGPFRAIEDPGYYRAFLHDAELGRNMAAVGADASDLQRVTIAPPAPGGGPLMVTATADTATKATTIADAVAPQLAGASARQLHNEALRAADRINQALAGPGIGRKRAETLRAQLAFIHTLGPFATHRAVVGAPAKRPPLSWADRVADALPGGGPDRPSPASVAIAGLVVVATLWALALVFVPPSGATYGPAPPRWVRRAAEVLGAEPQRRPVVIRPPEVAMPGWAAIGALSAIALSVAFILWSGRGEIFLGDEWDFVINRRGGDVDAWFKPINEHLMLFPVAIFKLLFVTAGASTFWPYRVCIALAHAGIVTLIFVIARRRVGWLVAALLTAPLVAFGPGFDVLLFPINLGFAGSLLGGLGMLLALDRGTRRGDVAAGGLLLLSLVSSSLGVCFAVGLAVELLLRRDRRRAWILLVPVALYGIWYLNYDLHPIRTGPLEPGQAPEFAFHLAAASLSALFGVPLGVETTGRGFHRAIELLAYAGLLAAVYAFCRRVLRPGVFTTRVALLATTLVGYLLLTGAARAYSHEWYASRYVYPTAILIVLLCAELARGVRLSRVALTVAIPVVLVATLLNVAWLHKDGKGRRGDTQVLAAELGAVDLARQHVPRNVLIDRQRVPWMTAAAYFEATDDIGSPSLSVPELRRALAGARSAADAILARYAVDVSTFDATPNRPPLRARVRGSAARYARVQGRCTVVTPPAARPVTAIVRLPGQGVGIVAAHKPNLTVSVRRFGPHFTTPVLSLSGQPVRHLVSAYPDRARQPWYVAVTSAGRVRLC